MKQYFKDAIIVTSTVFTAMVGINLLFGNNIQFNGFIKTLFLVSICAGVLTFILVDDEKGTTKQYLIKQVLYVISNICILFLFNNWFDWELGVRGLLQNSITIIVLFIAIKGFLFSGDQKQADEINLHLKKMKNKKTSDE